MKHPVLVIVLNCIAILVLGSLLIGAIALHQSGGYDTLFSGIFSFHIGDNFFVTDDSYEKGNGSALADGISDIDLDWAAGSVLLVVGEGNEIILEETSAHDLEDDQTLRWKVEDGKLTVRFGKRRGWSILSFGGSYPQKSLTVTIPASLAEKLGNVDLTTASADLTVSGISADRLTATLASGDLKLSQISASTIDLTNASGNLHGEKLVADHMDLDSASGNKKFVDCTVSGSVNCDSASGNFFFSGSLGELESDTASGDLQLELTAPARRIEIDSASGDLTVTLPADLPGLTVEMDSASGDLDIDFPVEYKGKRYATYGDGSMKVEVDSASGDAKFRMK